MPMPVRPPRLGFSGKVERLEVDWLEQFTPNAANVAEALGQKIPSDAMLKVMLATSMFLTAEQAERDAMQLKIFLGDLNDLTCAAKALRDRMASPTFSSEERQRFPSTDPDDRQAAL